MSRVTDTVQTQTDENAQVDALLAVPSTTGTTEPYPGRRRHPVFRDRLLSETSAATLLVPTANVAPGVSGIG